MLCSIRLFMDKSVTNWGETRPRKNVVASGEPRETGIVILRPENFSPTERLQSALPIYSSRGPHEL